MDDSVRKQDVLDANEALKNYIPMWDFFDIFVQVSACCSDLKGFI
jgi:hypothetical protein